MTETDELDQEHDEPADELEQAPTEQEPERVDVDERDDEPLPDGWAYNQRALVVGMTQSGKSELINHLFSTVRPQRVLVDTKHEFAIEGVAPATSPDQVDWTQPIIHYQDSTGEPSEFDELFSQAFYREGPRVVAVHELGDLCKFQPSRTPPAVIAYLNKGQGLGKGFLGGSQRPVMIPVHARTEASHVFVFVPKLGPDDHDTISRTVGVDPRQLAVALEELHREGGDHSFYWWPRGHRELIPSPPLPEQLRSQSIVDRIHPPA